MCKRFFYKTDKELQLEETNFYIDENEFVRIRDNKVFDKKAVEIFKSNWLSGDEHYLFQYNTSVRIPDNIPKTIGDRWEDVIDYCLFHLPQVKYTGWGRRDLFIKLDELHKHTEDYTDFIMLREIIKDKILKNTNSYQSFTRNPNGYWESRDQKGVYFSVIGDVVGLEYQKLEDFLYDGEIQEDEEYINSESEVIAKIPNKFTIENILINYK